MTRKLAILIVIALVIRIILLFAMNPHLEMNDDENVNYLTALNHHEGKGYTLYHNNRNAYIPTAFHGSFSIFVFEFLIEHNISTKSWVLFIYACCTILYAISIFCFFKISLSFLKQEKFALYASITYAFYPSVVLYIGTAFLYENIALPLLVIVIYRLLAAISNGFIKTDYLLIPAAVSASCLLRPQTIVVYAFIFVAYVFVMLQKKQCRSIPLLLLSIATAFVLHIPALIKNKKLFGEYTLSTQSGYEFLQGHNPTAKGSWNGSWRKPGNNFCQYAHREISNLDSLNELQESKARFRLGISWLKANPAAECMLCIKKAAIYFLPVNNEGGVYASSIINPLNLLVHVLFIFFIFTLIFKRSLDTTDLLLLSPVMASLALSLVFFTGYRWRYYAEPFMILYAWKCISVLTQQYLKRKNV